MAVGFTYSVERDCPICGEKMQVTKTRSRLIKVKQDSDFCVHYKDFNPYYYDIWVCSNCGYASDEKHFNTLREKEKVKISEFLKDRKVKIQYSEVRTREEAVNAFKLAIYFADLIEAPSSRMAGLYLKLSWLYREAGEEEKEQEVLKRALEAYDKALTTERFPIGSMTDTMVTYLIGELYRRTGNKEKAVQYLSRVIGDQRSRMEPAIYNLARDLWQDMRKEEEAE
ncbi:DUF2225 domain-containing protein [Anaerosinus massiliensis]|uniref:DUF2225 domain-containing protein n=1 Tax=Massilibacillus massiliensis TaxID=1806837 RepID=UPI000DA619DE|nr:DUF2225 domain-containing protein [Massilibacillus massiliensis]